MKRFAVLVGVVLVAASLLAEDAQAARLGGGKSVGRQSQNVTRREATPPQAPQGAGATQAQPSQAQPGAAAKGPTAQPQPQRNRWLGPLAGLAAGLGLAALASHFGFGEELASMMLVLLLVAGVVIVVRMVMARRAQPRPAFQSGYPQTGVGAEATVSYSPPPQQAPDAGYADTPVVRPSGAAPGPTWRIPADFDVEAFVRNAKLQFVRLQEAFDGARLEELREFTTPEMFDELKRQIDERGAAPNRTDVVKLEAEMLGVESGTIDHVASVRFRGLLRESEAAPAQDFDEVWNLTKPVSGQGGWVLAGIQQLQ